MNDYIDSLERQIKDLEKIISYCKQNNVDSGIIFSLTSLLIQKKDKFLKLIK